ACLFEWDADRHTEHSCVQLALRDTRFVEDPRPVHAVLSEESHNVSCVFKAGHVIAEYHSAPNSMPAVPLRSEERNDFSMPPLASMSRLPKASARSASRLSWLTKTVDRARGRTGAGGADGWISSLFAELLRALVIDIL